MANPLFNLLNQNNNMGFPQFMEKMKGQNPHEIINNMVKSGQINQTQLNEIQSKAKQMQSSFDQFKSMFGF